jgi:hypothetical protein
MFVRWALRTLSLVRVRSLSRPSVSKPPAGRRFVSVNTPQRQNKRGLLLGHLLLEAALVESLAHGADSSARTSPCDQTGAALLRVLACGRSPSVQGLGAPYEEGCDGGAGADCHEGCHDVGWGVARVALLERLMGKVGVGERGFEVLRWTGLDRKESRRLSVVTRVTQTWESSEREL